MRFATAARRVLDGGRAVAASASLAFALVLATPSASAREAEAANVALRVAVDGVLAGGEQSLDLVLLLDSRLGGNVHRRQAAAREFDHLIALLRGGSATARARREKREGELEPNGGAAALDPAITDNVRVYRQLVPFFGRHSFDCNQRTVLHLEAARRLGVPPPAFARSLDHAGLIFEDQSLVLDPYDGKLRTLLDFALGRGHSLRRGAGYFLRTPRRHYLVVAGPGGSLLRPLVAAEHPDLVAPLEPLASLLLDAAAIASSPATARAYAELALALDPTSADAHDTLANVVADLDPAGAAAEYAAALELDPHAARVHYNLAVLLHTRGELAAAAGEYRAALALQPTLLVAIENLGAIHPRQPNGRAEAAALLARGQELAAKEPPATPAARGRRALPATQPGGRVPPPPGTRPSRAFLTLREADRTADPP